MDKSQRPAPDSKPPAPPIHLLSPLAAINQRLARIEQCLEATGLLPPPQSATQTAAENGADTH